MSKVTLDETLRDRLNGLCEETEFCDETGRTLGHFLPIDEYQHLMIRFYNALISDEEVEQARQERGGHTTEEVLKYLKGL